LNEIPPSEPLPEILEEGIDQTSQPDEMNKSVDQEGSVDRGTNQGSKEMII